MASMCVPISAISGGRKDLKLKARVAHIWLIRDKDKSDEIVCMNMLLVDEKVSNLMTFSIILLAITVSY